MIDGAVKIVLRYRAQNDSVVAVTSRLAFLLDVQVGKEDGIDLLYPGRTGRNWKFFDTLPARVIAFDRYLADDGLIGELVTDVEDVNLPPRSLAVGDWVRLSLLPWRDAADPGTPIMDAAVSLRWDSVVVPPGTTWEIGAFAYGASGAQLCGSPLSVLTTVPELIDDMSFHSVEAYVLSELPGSWSGSMRLEVDSSLEIDPATPGIRGILETSAGATPHFHWSIRPSKPLITPLRGHLRFRVVSPQVADTLEDVCQRSIAINGYTYDRRKPVLTLRRKATCTSTKGFITITDSTALDAGLGEVFVRASNAEVTGPASIVPGISIAYYDYRVIDRLLVAAIVITAVDRGGQRDSIVVDYCPLPDPGPPIVTIDTIDRDEWRVRFYDSRPWDRGLAGVSLQGWTNMGYRFDNDTVPAVLNIYVLDTTGTAWIEFQVRDKAQNVSPTFRIEYSRLAKVGRSNSEAVAIYPNPASAHVQVTFATPSMRTVTLVDALGRARGIYRASTTWLTLETDHLPRGAYYVWVTESDRTYRIPLRLE